MNLSNKHIGDCIRQARKDRNCTQSELADALGKTTGAISQLEQGNVQVSVVELAKIADFLNKPIEYFLGEEYMRDDVQTLLAVIRKMLSEIRNEQVIMIHSLLEIQSISDRLTANLDISEEELLKEAKIALSKLRIQRAILRSIGDQTQDAVEKLEEIIVSENISDD